MPKRPVNGGAPIQERPLTHRRGAPGVVRGVGPHSSISYALNPTEWNNPDFQALFRQIGTTMDDKKRQELIFKAQETLADDPPWLWMYFQYDLYGVNNRLDWKPRADEFVLLHDAKLKQ